MAGEKNDGVNLSAELAAQLLALREELLQQYHARESDKLLLEQSLALRSQIAYITSVVEPGTHEMWPDYTPAEEEYLESQAQSHQRDANHVAMAALGPFAMPAVVAENFGAPARVVANVIELGFDATAVIGLGSRGARRLSMVEPVVSESASDINAIRVVNSQLSGVSIRPSFVANEPHPQLKKVVPDVTDVKADGYAMNNGNFDRPATVTRLQDFNNWRTAARKHYDAAIRSGHEVEPILDWLRAPKLEKLGVALHAYSNGRGQMLADLKGATEGAGGSIDELLEHYRLLPEGHSEARMHAQAFEKRLVEDIAGANGEPDPTKLRLVVAKLNAGQYMTARDYASLEYVRDEAHRNFVHQAVETYLGVYKRISLAGEPGQEIVRDAVMQAEAVSPYAIRQSEHEHHSASKSDYESER